MKHKGMLALLGVAVVMSVGCGHMAEYKNKVDGVVDGVRTAKDGIDELNQAFQGNPSVTEAAPAQGKEPKEQGIAPEAPAEE